MAKDYSKWVDQGKKRMAIRVVTGIITLVVVAIKVIILMVNKNMGTIFLWGNFTQELLETILNVLISIFLMAFIGSFFRQRMFTIIFTAVAVLLSAFFIYRYAFYYGAPKCYNFASSDGVTKVVAQEEHKHDQCNITFYLRTSDMWVRKVGEISTEGYQPFANNAAQIKFSSANRFVVTYTPAEGAAQVRQTIELK